jgi:hypothetical protein
VQRAESGKLLLRRARINVPSLQRQPRLVRVPVTAAADSATLGLSDLVDMLLTKAF